MQGSAADLVGGEGKTPVRDLMPLAGMPLENLDIRDTPAAELPRPDWPPAGCAVNKGQDAPTLNAAPPLFHKLLDAIPQ